MNYFPELREAMVKAAGRHYQDAEATSAQEVPRPSRRRRYWRGRPLAVMAVLCLASATGALAAAGVFQAGSPVGANVPPTPNTYTGVAVPGSVQVLRLGVSDPAGGPAWGLRLDRTTRGYVCVQPGRIDYGKVGALGITDAFGNDGRFHAFSNNYQETLGCATADAHGHAFVSVVLKAVPASAMELSCQRGSVSNRDSRPHQTKPPKGGRPICSAGTMRALYYGMLGPDAVSVTYADATGKLVTRPTSGPDGAFLVVGPAAPYCTRTFAGSTCGDELVGTVPNAGVIRAVTYRDGHTCRVPAVENPLKAPNGACPPVGYSPSVPTVTAAQVASPVTVRDDGVRYWCARGDTTEACGKKAPAGFRRRPGSAHREFAISFIARVAVTNADSYYAVHMEPWSDPLKSEAAQCRGVGAQPVVTDVRAGQRVQVLWTTPLQCVGTDPGTVSYTANATSQNTIAGYNAFSRSPSSTVQVGRFKLHVP